LDVYFSEFNSCKIIHIYYSSIDDEKKEATIELFRNGEALLTVATDAMSLGVDISDIERVIQWGITERLTLDTLVQRIGRAGRQSSMLGLAIIYTPRDLLDPVSAEGIKASNPGQTEDIPLDMGPDEEWEDIVDATPRYADRDLRLFALPVEPETVLEVQQMRQKMYRHINSLKDAARAGDVERKAAKKDGVGNTIKKQPIDKIEPGIIWFLNTTGCRHRCILEYMRFPDVFEDDKQESWCCDNCAIRKANIMSMPRGYPLPEPASLRPESKRKMGAQTDWKAINDGAPPRPNYKEETEKIVTDVLSRWRRHIYVKLVERGAISRFLPDQVVLSDRAIKDIVSKQRLKNATTSNGLRTVLMKAEVDVSSNMLREKDIDEMFNMIDATFEVLERGTIHIEENPGLILARTAQNRFDSAVRDQATASAAFNTNPMISQTTNTSRDNHPIHPQTTTTGLATIPIRPQITNARANKQVRSQPTVTNLQHTPATPNSRSLAEPPVTGQLVSSTAEVTTLRKRICSEPSAPRKRRKELLDITNSNVLRAGTNKRVIKESARQKAAREETV